MKIAVFIVLIFAAVCSGQITVTVSNVTVEDRTEARFVCSYNAPGIVGTPTLSWYADTPDDGRVKLAVYTEGSDSDTYIVNNDMGLVLAGSVLTATADVTHNQRYQAMECEVDFGANGSKVARFKYGVYKWPSTEPETNILQSVFDRTVGTTPETIGSCVTGYGYPTPTITFLKNGSPIELDTADIGDFLDMSVTDVASDGISKSTTKDILKVIENSDDQANFQCRVETKMGEFSDVKTADFEPFRVNYATDSVTVGLVEDLAILHNEVTVRCEANGYPEAEISIDGESTNEVPVLVTIDDNNREFVCVATHTYNGVVTAVNSTYTMQVTYNNVPTTIVEPTVASLGDEITLSCAGAGNPEPMLSWFKGDIKVPATGTYTIEVAEFESNGEYRCRSTSEYDQLNRDSIATVTVNGIKLIGDEVVDLTNVKEDTVELECAVKSNPAAIITWEGEENEVKAIKTTEGMYGYKSIITIGPLTAEHSEMSFTCTASNGMDTVTKIYNFPSISAGGAPIAGIIIGILVAILLVAVILAVLYNKGIICKKGEKGDETAKDITPGNVDGGDVETGKETGPETEKLMEGNGEASNP